jgi:hypothetical protein
VALPREMCAGTGFPRGVARWNVGLSPRRANASRFAVLRWRYPDAPKNLQLRAAMPRAGASL